MVFPPASKWDAQDISLALSVLDVGTVDYRMPGAAAAERLRTVDRQGGRSTCPSSDSIALSLPLIHQNQFVAEAKERHTPWDQPGKSSSFNGLRRANMGMYSDALALAAATGPTPSRDAFATTVQVRRRAESGATVDAGSGDVCPRRLDGGRHGGYDFTDIDQSLQISLSLQGSRWGRPDDTVGLAAVANQISDDVKAYLAARGLGGIIGDGQLPEAGPEQIIETYYSLADFSFAKVTGDYQFINNPAYNRQRGPVSVFALRLHAEF